jgi:hypothetical protein
VCAERTKEKRKNKRRGRKKREYKKEVERERMREMKESHSDGHGDKSSRKDVEGHMHSLLGKEGKEDKRKARCFFFVVHSSFLQADSLGEKRNEMVESNGRGKVPPTSKERGWN